MMKYVSLFSGAGGMDLGADRAGWECVAQVEKDKNCQAVLTHHWPDVPKWGDIADVDGTELPSADAVIFGSPCQDLSVAGRRAGIHGEASSLFFQAIRVIREMQDAGNTPTWVVWENVAGALSSNQGQDFAIVLHEMADAGALVLEWAVLDARWFGVPQRRRRVFLVACFDPGAAERCPDPLLPVAESLPGHLGEGDAPGQVVAALTANGVGASDDETWAEVGPDRPAPTLNAMGNGSESRATVVAIDSTWSGAYSPSIDVSPPLKQAHGTVPAIPDGLGVRRLTPRECERLMGWPDDHTLVTNARGKPMADSPRYKMCGNGVASPVMAWVAAQINNATTSI